MILSGEEIQDQLGQNIIIDPFEPGRVNSNSYNLTLHNELLVYEEVVLDLRAPNRFRRLEIPAEGLVLQPGQLYLGRTAERTETRNFVPMVGGRSSVGRLGLYVNSSTSFGDVGFCGFWTLEMFTVQPIRIYAGIEICQISYHEVVGELREYTGGKYQNNRDIQPSYLYRELGCDEVDGQLELDFEGCLRASTSNS